MSNYFVKVEDPSGNVIRSFEVAKLLVDLNGSTDEERADFCLLETPIASDKFSNSHTVFHNE